MKLWKTTIEILTDHQPSKHKKPSELVEATATEGNGVELYKHTVQQVDHRAYGPDLLNKFK